MLDKQEHCAQLSRASEQRKLSAPSRPTMRETVTAQKAGTARIALEVNRASWTVSLQACYTSCAYRVFRACPSQISGKRCLPCRSTLFSAGEATLSPALCRTTGDPSALPKITAVRCHPRNAFQSYLTPHASRSSRSSTVQCACRGSDLLGKFDAASWDIS